VANDALLVVGLLITGVVAFDATVGNRSTLIRGQFGAVVSALVVLTGSDGHCSDCKSKGGLSGDTCSNCGASL
jgi:hypothetical protein